MNLRRNSITFVVLTAVLAAAAAAIALPTAGASLDPLDAQLNDLRAATARYHSVEQAEKAGYVADAHCAFSPLGGMGYHYGNAALMADDAIDPLQPEILVYAPTESGKLKLVAVEYWKRDADQLLFTSGDRPVLFGRGFDGPMPGHNPTMPVHYDLHVWLYEENPRGMFFPFNPDVVCPA
jgi:hypothetical protein